MKNFLKRIDKIIFKSIYKAHDEYKELLKNSLKDCATLLDIGCGYISPAYEFFKNMEYTVGIDGYEKAVEGARAHKVHTRQYVLDVKKIGTEFAEKSFDCVIALDLIEHLIKADGYKLISDAEKIAKKKIIIFTPNGFVEQNEYDNNKLQRHFSGWSVNDFRKLGYKVTGVNGLKYLRESEARLKFKPIWFWHRISIITQFFCKRIPVLAYQLYCEKIIK